MTVAVGYAPLSRTCSYATPVEVLVAGTAASPNGPADLPPEGTFAFAVSPPLPAGLAFDPATGTISGTPSVATTGATYTVTATRDDGAVCHAAVYIEVATLPVTGPNNVFVSTSGSDAWPGTKEQPYRTIAKGISVLSTTKHTLYIRGGSYAEYLYIAKTGTTQQPITIRSYPGERVFIDAATTDFLAAPNTAWVDNPDPAAHPDEYVSTQTYAASPTDAWDRGAFVDDDGRYVRLLSYNRIEDLRATNETFDWIQQDDPRPGPVLVDPQGDRTRATWTYFGPGLWYNRTTQKIHIRLSHTHNDVPGLEDYSGPTDPRLVRLAITPMLKIGLKMEVSHFVHLRHLTLRFGGTNTTLITNNNSDLVFDHFNVLASQYGLRISTAQRITVKHCLFDGGVPTWTFRNDFKDVYSFHDGGVTASNELVSWTHRSSMIIGGDVVDSEIAYSEFRNGHDVYVGGQNTNFHHNWIHNLQDEGMVVNESSLSANMLVHDNVWDGVLSPISYAVGLLGGQRYYYRNIFDQRTPTAGFRPRGGSDPSRWITPWRYGTIFKWQPPVADLFFYHNTAVLSHDYVYGNGAIPLFAILAMANTPPAAKRQSVNNLFLAFVPETAADTPIAVYPSVAQINLGAADGTKAYVSKGNLWDRHAVCGIAPQAPLFVCGTRVPGDNCNALRDAPKLAVLQSHPSYAAVGWEAGSVEDPPLFASGEVGPDALPSDDLRPASSSPARRSADDVPREWPDSSPGTDIGALYHGQPALGVGIHGGQYY